MTKKEKLITALKDLIGHNDPEHAHGVADDLLIEYINDKEVKKTYDKISKWYA